MKIWLDDERPVPDETWTLVKNVSDLIDILHPCEWSVDEISFDHDLGIVYGAQGWGTGYDAICMIEGRCYQHPNYVPPYCRVHTANPGVRIKMQQAADNINKIREERK